LRCTCRTIYAVETALARVKVLLPTPLATTPRTAARSKRGAHARRALRRPRPAYPGLRFRVIDEQGAIRPHIKVFVNRVQARSARGAARAEDEIWWWPRYRAAEPRCKIARRLHT
jgi:hypothetical protein